MGNRTIISIIGNPRTAEMAALPVSPEVPESQKFKNVNKVINKQLSGISIFTNDNDAIFLGFFQEVIIQFSNKGQSQVFEGQSRTVK